MWCAKCQSEVAVEARPNSQRLHCATCGTEISPRPHRPSPTGAGQPPASPPGSTTGGSPPTPPSNNPQELLARWTGSQMFDPYGPLINNETHKPQPAAPRSETPKPPAVKTPAANVTPPDHSAKLRIDSAFADGWSEVPPPHTGIPVGATPQSRPRPPKLTEREMPGGHRADSPSRLQGPHFNPARMNHRPPENNSWVAWFGQTLAYLGAATLTIGAGMVLVGYMGGPSHYAPTGWFTTTVGQMLLFLGVVTLVSAGMEQTTVEVAKRIDVLGDQLERMEYSAQAKSSATDPELEAELRAEIAQLRQQLSEHRRD